MRCRPHSISGSTVFGRNAEQSLLDPRIKPHCSVRCVVGRLGRGVAGGKEFGERILFAAILGKGRNSFAQAGNDEVDAVPELQNVAKPICCECQQAQAVVEAERVDDGELAHRSRWLAGFRVAERRHFLRDRRNNDDTDRVTAAAAVF